MPIARELAVPLAQRPLSSGLPVGRRKGTTLHERSRVDAGDGAERGCQVDLTHRIVHDGGSHPGAGRGPPHEGQPHERVGVVRPLVQQTEVALELAVVGGEEDVGVIEPSPLPDRLQDASTCLVDEFVHHVDLGVDLTDLVVGELRGHERGRSTLEVGERPSQ